MFIILLITIFILNLLDLYFTKKGIREGYLEEANPLMDRLLRSGKAIPFKLLAAIVFVVVLWIGRGSFIARLGVGLVVFVYSYILKLHICYIREHKREVRNR